MKRSSLVGKLKKKKTKKENGLKSAGFWLIASQQCRRLLRATRCTNVARHFMQIGQCHSFVGIDRLIPPCLFLYSRRNNNNNVPFVASLSLLMSYNLRLLCSARKVINSGASYNGMDRYLTRGADGFSLGAAGCLLN